MAAVALICAYTLLGTDAVGYITQPFATDWELYLFASEPPLIVGLKP